MAQGVQRQLWFALTHTLGVGYIDIAQCLSLVNRKGYSQNKTYYVEGYQFVPGVNWTPGSVSSCDIDVVGNTWTTENSHRQAFALWKKMNRQTDIDQGTWADFKVFMDAAHYVGTAGGTTYNTINLIPIDGNQAAFIALGAEWDYSLFVSPTAAAGVSTTNACHMLGDDSTVNNPAIATDGSHPIIQGYADTRTTVQSESPEVPGDAANSWITNLFDDGDTHLALVNIQEVDNDQPPYAKALDAPGGDNPIYVGGSESGFGGMLQARMRVTSTGDQLFGQGGEALAGLLRVGFSGADSGETGLLCVNIAPGDYQGVAAKAI